MPTLKNSSMKNKYTAGFYEGGIFHVYNRTNNKEPLFTSDNNRSYFLKQYAKYLQPFVDTFCWCLLPNHFHFLVRIKSAAAIINHLKSVEVKNIKPIEKKFIEGQASLRELMELEWKCFFTAYSMAFNKEQNRSGNLFNRPFKRVEVDKDSHFTQAVIYIHANSVTHKLSTSFTAYQWSSWHSIISNKPTLLYRQELLDWFGGLQRLIQVHKEQTQFYYNSDITVEDE